MLQLIVLFAISWLLLWLFGKKNLSVLGLAFTKVRMKYFLVLFVISALLSATAFLLRMYLAKEVYAFNQALTTKTILLETWYQFRSVFTEELLCRGALLYILIRKTGQATAILISSILFAAFHWMNAGVWGNLIQMSIVFTFTFAMGLLLAYSYARTFSLLLPLAIHFGWNLTQNFIFPDSATGNHIIVLTTSPPIVTISSFAFFAMILIPKIAVLVIDYLIVKGYRRVYIREFS